ncbi:MAG: hypothetical protein HYU63_08095 [Armatimonadetes bacterium]|nr:hypothetical protein [Armatimonadota bacterium]
MSNLPYECGISRPRFFYKSVQTELEVIDLEGAEIYVGEKIAPGSFGYAVATSKKLAKVGVITHLKAKSCFENLINSKFLKERLKSSLELVKYRRIPMGMPKSSQNGRIIALGDAAAQLKTTTGGGVYTGLVCSDILVKNIKEAYNGKDFSLKKIGNYDKAWKKAIGLELQAGLLVRSFFEKVEDKYLNKLFGLMTVPAISEIISQKGDFDRHRDLIIALMKIPEVRKLVLEIIKRNLPQKRFFTSIVNYVDSLI